jgi:hypothetical protein
MPVRLWYVSSPRLVFNPADFPLRSGLFPLHHHEYPERSPDNLHLLRTSFKTNILNQANYNYG